MTTAQQRYVYAILPAGTPLPAGLTGFAGRSLEHVPYRNLAAATSAVDPGDIQPGTDDVMLHESIVEALHQSGPLLPVRFGTVLAGEGDVERALAEQYDILTADLERLGDKIEFGLTVLWEEIPAEDEDSSNEPESAEGPGAQYLHARVAEHRREAATRARAEALAESLDRVLRQHAAGHRRTIYPSGRIAVRAAYLLPADSIDVFQSAFDLARQQLRGVRCLLNGPWPPYSFVTAPNGRTAVTSQSENQSARAPLDVPG